MPRPYDYATLTHSSRNNNEDRIAVFEAGDAVVVVVADGAGGLYGGATAADAIVAAVGATARDPAADITNAATWVRLLTDVDKKLAAAQGESTAVVVTASTAGIVGASAGDSEAWLIHQNNVDDLTAGQKKTRVGSGRAAAALFFRLELRGVLVVGTDGLFKYSSQGAIVEATTTGTPAEQVGRLHALVQLPSGKYNDDVGAVVVQPYRAQ